MKVLLDRTVPTPYKLDSFSKVVENLLIFSRRTFSGDATDKQADNTIDDHGLHLKIPLELKQAVEEWRPSSIVCPMI